MPMSVMSTFLKMMEGSLVNLPSPSSLSFMWNLGSLLGLCLVVQMATGIFLAMHYSPNMELAFQSMVHMMSDVNYGWAMSLAHANGASMFFLCVYLHMASGIYYGGYLNSSLWLSGLLLFVLMMATAFLGYVLPWGQMSFWGATVMTNFFSAIPVIGNKIVMWLWGGFSVGQATLNSFYSLHFLVPFVMAAVVMMHLVILHEEGSNQSTGAGKHEDSVPFHPYYVVKDLYGFWCFAIIFSMMGFFNPFYLGDAENFIMSNPLVTPVHMVPEWYFLFAYAMLSAMPNKLGGLMALVLSLAVVVTLPFTHKSNIKSLTFSPLGKLLFWVFVSNFIILTLLGAKPVEEPYVLLSSISSIIYFLFYMSIISVSGLMENKILFG